MIFEPVRTGGCISYLIGREERCVAALIHPALEQIDQCETLAAATPRGMGFLRAVALAGGLHGWREAGFPLGTGDTAS